MRDDDNEEQARRANARPLNGDGLECFNLKVQLNLETEQRPSASTEDSSEQTPANIISLSAYWLDNLNTPVNERIKTRFTPGTVFFGLQQRVDEVKKLPQDARVQIALGSDKPDTD